MQLSPDQLTQLIARVETRQRELLGDTHLPMKERRAKLQGIMSLRRRLLQEQDRAQLAT